MPVIVSRRAVIARQFLLSLPVLLLVAAAVLHEPDSLHDRACLTQHEGLIVCASSEMARVTRTGRSRLEHPRFDLNSDGAEQLSWQVLRNETIAFQLILRRSVNSSPDSVAINIAQSPLHTTVFKAHYHDVKNAGYKWGPATDVLPYPGQYPDALIPQKHGCFDDKIPLFNDIKLPNQLRNQSVWIEIYIPDTIEPGMHVQNISLKTELGETSLPINLQVLDAALPHTPSIDAIGEIYRAYNLEGAGFDRSSRSWQIMAQCYQQLAHQHRMVFIERTPDAPQSAQDWQSYASAFGPSLSGELFSAKSGYSGTGKDIPVKVWRTPWPQDYDVTVNDSLSEQQLLGFTTLARDWTSQVEKFNWNQSRFFSYVFDEVDGPSNQKESDPERYRYIKRVHNDMQQVQQAIDDGSTGIDLLWTSHSDPTIWQDDPATTLVNRVRLWAPNAHAANTDFLTQRMEAGERAWFYHSGHPAVGGHSINLPGSDMRSWGVIGARYGIQGQLMWAVNLGSDLLPFAQPSYKPDEDRVGNGVMVYPGNQLPRIGFPAVAGPIPSMRLKAWHRGLQDAELYFLARERFPVETKRLIAQLIPRALGEAVVAGDTDATWPRDSASWIDWRDKLVHLIAQP